MCAALAPELFAAAGDLVEGEVLPEIESVAERYMPSVVQEARAVAQRVNNTINEIKAVGGKVGEFVEKFTKNPFVAAVGAVAADRYMSNNVSGNGTRRVSFGDRPSTARARSREEDFAAQRRSLATPHQRDSWVPSRGSSTQNSDSFLETAGRSGNDPAPSAFTPARPRTPAAPAPAPPRDDDGPLIPSFGQGAPRSQPIRRPRPYDDEEPELSHMPPKMDTTFTPAGYGRPLSNPSVNPYPPKRARPGTPSAPARRSSRVRGPVSRAVRRTLLPRSRSVSRSGASTPHPQP